MPRHWLPLLAGCVLALSLARTIRAENAAGGGTSSTPTVAARNVVDIRPNKRGLPTVRAIAPLNEANVIFLNREGQVGIAKFTPGLGLIAWDLYSTIKQDALAGIVPGNNLSVLSATPADLTQAFDTDDDLKLDFFQAVVSEWPGKKDGVVITAGPVSAGDGRVLLALSPHRLEKTGPAKASVVAWHPQWKGIRTVATSVLPIRAMAVSPKGILATRLYMPKYKGGFYVSLNELAPFDPAKKETSKEETPSSQVPGTQPSLLIPAELTGKQSPEQICFVREDRVEKLLITSPDSNQLLEISPEKAGNSWQGSILVRQKTPLPLETVCYLGADKILGGGPKGFLPIDRNDHVFRIRSVQLKDDGLEVNFTKPLNRFTGVRPDSFSVRAFPLQSGKGEKGITIPEPVIESDGLTVVLRSAAIPGDSVIRIKCMNLTSETGEKLTNPLVFYTVHQR